MAEHVAKSVRPREDTLLIASIASLNCIIDQACVAITCRIIGHVEHQAMKPDSKMLSVGNKGDCLIAERCQLGVAGAVSLSSLSPVTM